MIFLFIVKLMAIMYGIHRIQMVDDHSFGHVFYDICT